MVYILGNCNMANNYHYYLVFTRQEKRVINLLQCMVCKMGKVNKIHDE